MTERNLPDLLRTAERRVNAFVFKKSRESFASIPANRDRDIDLLLMEAAEEIERMRSVIKDAHRKIEDEWGGDSTGCLCKDCSAVSETPQLK